ncbi:putative serine protease K12H4.7 [Oppia nitens]|uniref:putative serine protease K12H4.7 n=1 Tax=Oppia nitens TaxID=1686743 RepID=UPI0023DAD18A|nr:putative serine protease K12H4.7 [Oppia nitens]
MKSTILNVLIITLYTLYGYCSGGIVKQLPINGIGFNNYGMLRPPVPDNHIQTLPDNWFDQRLDHFNTSDSRTFKQRYFINDKYYKTGGPVFLVLDGEGESSDYFITKGAVALYAQQFNALTIELEHRYYGHSVPTSDLSLDNLRYLSSEQALKDIEQFIMKTTDSLSLASTSKWIAFGGSYAGALAAWVREKYPQAVAGSVASSAPVGVSYEFNQYFGVVSEALGTICTKPIREAVHQLADLLKTPEGRQSISKQFNLCTPLNGTDQPSVQLMWFNLIVPFAVAAQHNGKPGVIGIQEVCEVMAYNKDGSTPLQRWSKLHKQFSKGQCLSYDYNESVKAYRDISKTSPVVQIGMRQWTYQTCNEFGFFQTTGLVDSPFGYRSVPVEYFLKQCVDIFGKQFTPQSIQKAVNRTNAYYGGFRPNVTNVVFPNGSTDPWHALSVLKDLNNSTRAVYIHGTSHGSDLFPPQTTDPQELTDARKTIAKQLQLFLQ